MKHRHWLLLALGAGVLLLPAGGVRSAQAAGKVFLNELSIIGSEGAEVYNLGPDPVDISGYRIVGTGGFYEFPSGTILDPGEYLAVSMGNIQSDIGGETDLIDLASNVLDGVFYGQQGGAPLAHAGASLCRAPDGSADPPRHSPEHARWWTIDFTPTPGAQNNAPPPDLGSSISINEIDDALPNQDTVEFYNPTALLDGIPLVGWRLTDGHSVAMLTGVVQGGDVLSLSTGTDIEVTRLAYLFNNLGVRVDQVGTLGAPDPPGSCIGRCPDGAGPHRGFNYITSGGGVTWIPMFCTIGELNTTAPQCGQSDVEAGGMRAGAMLRLAGSNPVRKGGAVACVVKVPAETHVRIDVLTAAGTLVTTLQDGVLSEGEHALSWRAHGEPAGVYFVRLTAGEIRESRTVVLVP